MGTSIITEKPTQREKLEPPPMWHVMLKNDDFTSFEFVILVLMDLFRHTPDAAEAIAQEVHDRGQGSAGVFSRDVAETKVGQIHALAAREGYPLKAVIEQAI